MTPWKKHSLVLAAYFAMALLHTWPQALHLFDQTILSFNSIPSCYLFAEHSLLFLEHPFSLTGAFSPQTAAPLPTPFFFHGTSLGMGALFAPFYWATRNLYFSGAVVAWILLIGSAYSMFLLARYLFESDRAGFLAGAIFSFAASSTFLTWDFVSLFLIIFPLILLCFLRFIHEDRPLWLYAAVGLLALQFYAYFYHCLYAVYLLAALAAWRRKQVFTKDHIPVLVRAGLLGLVLILPLALPYLRVMAAYGLDSMANAGESLFSYTFSYSPSEWFNVAPNNLLYGKWLAQTAPTHAFPDYPHAPLFPGVLVWHIILTGAAGMPKKRMTPGFLAGLLVFAILASTGLKPLQFFRHEMSEAVVLRFLADVLPLASIVRNPNRLIVFYNLALALLAAGAFAGFEKRLFLKKGGATATCLCLAAAAVFNLENLSIPRELHNYDAVFGPAQCDVWLAENNPLDDPAHTILHIPGKEAVYQYDAGIPPARLYVESITGHFRHLFNRHPIANICTSFTPAGFITPEFRSLPEIPAQQGLHAIGVRLVVVHGGLLYGAYKDRFSVGNMTRRGFELLAAFEDGDAVYRMSRDVQTARELIVLPHVDGGILRVDALTPSTMDALVKGVQPPIEWWVDPLVCKRRYLWITVSDGEGRLHRLKRPCFTPLTAQNHVRLVKENLWGLGLKGPFSVVSVEWNENHLRVPPGVAGQAPRS